jgi:hypothetical protein
MSRFGGRPSPAMVVAWLALACSVGGTAIAASQIGRNSVGAREFGKVVPRTKEETIAGGGNGQAVAKCNRGEQLLSGGATLPGADPNERPSVEQSGPKGKRGWLAAANNDDSLIEVTLRVTALCLTK